MAVRLAYWNGYYAEDAPGYVADAAWFALGNYHARDYVNGLNVGTYIPVAVPLFLFGKSEFALSLWPLACSLLGTLSMAGAAGLLFGRPAALLGAFLYATYPGDVFFSTVVMPDSLQAGWLTASVFLVVLAHSDRVARKLTTLAAAGVAMGACHLIRANDAMLVPVGVTAVAACSAWWKREPSSVLLRSCGIYLAGVAAVYVIEGGAYLWSVGDFLHRLNVVARHYGSAASIAAAGLNTDPRTIPFSIVPPLTWWRQGWQPLTHEQSYHGLLFVLALVMLALGLGTAAMSRSRLNGREFAGAAMALAWLLWPIVYHQFGSQSLIAYVPMHRLSRHLVVYGPGAIFAVVVGSCLTAGAMRHWRPPAYRLALMVAGSVLGIHLWFNWAAEEIAHGDYQRIKGTYRRILEHLLEQSPADVPAIVADSGDLAYFDFWMNPLGRQVVRMVPFAGVAGCDAIGAGAVLTFSNDGWERLNAPIIRETVGRLPCLLEPPPGWRLVYDGYPERVYLVAGTPDAAQ